MSVAVITEVGHRVAESEKEIGSRASITDTFSLGAKNEQADAMHYDIPCM